MLSCVPVSFFKEIIDGRLSFSDFGSMLKQRGLEYIDLSVALFKSRDEKYLKRIRSDLENQGIKILTLVTYSDFLRAGQEERNKEVEAFGKDVECAATIGARYIRITAGPENPQMPRSRAIEWVIDGMLQSAEYGSKYGVKMLFENHAKPSVWDRPDFSLDTEVFLAISEGIKKSEIGILFDTANPLVFGDDPVELLAKVIDRVECVHISDIKRKGKQEPVVIGTGVVPFEAIFALLKKEHYKGVISIEEVSRTGWKGLEQAIEFTQRLLDKYDLRGSSQ
jgi:sugar phosphate isomerase/epimerase